MTKVIDPSQQDGGPRSAWVLLTDNAREQWHEVVVASYARTSPLDSFDVESRYSATGRVFEGGAWQIVNVDTDCGARAAVDAWIKKQKVWPKASKVLYPRESNEATAVQGHAVAVAMPAKCSASGFDLLAFQNLNVAGYTVDSGVVGDIIAWEVRRNVAGYRVTIAVPNGPGVRKAVHASPKVYAGLAFHVAAWHDGHHVLSCCMNGEIDPVSAWRLVEEWATRAAVAAFIEDGEAAESQS